MKYQNSIKYPNQITAKWIAGVVYTMPWSWQHFPYTSYHNIFQWTNCPILL